MKRISPAVAVAILEKFEYSSDGFPKRYPTSQEFDAAMAAIRALVTPRGEAYERVRDAISNIVREEVCATIFGDGRSDTFASRLRRYRVVQDKQACVECACITIYRDTSFDETFIVYNEDWINRASEEQIEKELYGLNP